MKYHLSTLHPQAQVHCVEISRHINLSIFKHNMLSRQGPALLYFVTQQEKLFLHPLYTIL